MNSRVFVGCLVLINILLFPFAATGFAQQAAPPFVRTLDDKTGYVIPFTYDRLLCPYIVVEASVNGRPPLPFIIDTGTDNDLTLDYWAASWLGLKPNGKTGSGNDGHLPFRFASVKNFTLKTVDDRHLSIGLHDAAVLDLSRLQGSVNVHIAGIIGAKIVDRFLVRLDFVGKAISLRPPAHSAMNIPGAISLPLINKGMHDRFYTHFVVTPGISTDVLVDTGSNTTSIPSSIAIKLNPIATIVTGGFFLDFVYLCEDMLLDSFLIDGFVEHNVVIEDLPDGLTPTFGTDLMARFCVTLDFHSKRIVLEPLQTNISIPPDGRTGIDLRDGGSQYSVASVSQNSPASAVGIRIGDVLTNVDGHSLHDLPLSVAQNVLDGIAGTTAKLTLRRGNTEPFNVSFIRPDIFSRPPTAVTGLFLKRLNREPFEIVGIRNGCAADRAGLVVGDLITVVEDVPASTMTSEQIAEMMPKHHLRLMIRHRGKKEPYPVTIQVQDTAPLIKEKR